MLIKAERYGILKTFKVFCVVSLLPTQVDLTNWHLRPQSKRMNWICALSFILYALHVLYKSGSLVYTILFDSNVPLHQLIIHTVMAMTTSTYVFWYIYLYVCNPSLFATYIASTLRGHVGGSLGHEDELKKHWSMRLREYSMQDMIAIGMPYIAVLTLPTVIAAYVYDPSMRLLLYAALPKKHQNWATLGLCTLEEFRLLFISVSIAVPIWQVQVVSLEHVSHLAAIVWKIKNGAYGARSVYRTLCNLQLYVSTLNHVNSYLIFTWKLLSIAVCILNGYAAVAHFSEYPVFGIMYYAILLDVTFIYTIMYQKAFKIPQLFDQAAASSILHIRGYRQDAFTRQIRSIRRAGIKVGNFHTMERASTLIFINFVLNNIVSMLVAYG